MDLYLKNLSVTYQDAIESNPALAAFQRVCKAEVVEALRQAEASACEGKSSTEWIELEKVRSSVFNFDRWKDQIRRCVFETSPDMVVKFDKSRDTSRYFVKLSGW